MRMHFSFYDLRAISKAIASIIALALFSGICIAATPSETATSAPATQPSDSDWKPLFNGTDLQGFYTWFPKAGKNNDPTGMVRADQGMIHMMALAPTTQPQEIGYLATEKSYGDCDLKFEYKWGDKKFPPRAALPRDSGCLYFMNGPDKLWPNVIEFQMQEQNAGDLYVLNNAYSLKTTVKSLTDRVKIFAADGQPWTLTGNRVTRGQTLDSSTDWNAMELILNGNSATQIINGQIVNRVEQIVTRADNKPVTEGRLGFQCQAAEMYLRNIRIKLIQAPK